MLETSELSVRPPSGSEHRAWGLTSQGRRAGASIVHHTALPVPRAEVKGHGAGLGFAFEGRALMSTCPLPPRPEPPREQEASPELGPGLWPCSFPPQAPEVVRDGCRMQEGVDRGEPGTLKPGVSGQCHPAVVWGPRGQSRGDPCISTSP